MKLIDTRTKETIADMVTNHSMSIDAILTRMHYSVDNETGQIYDDDTGRALDAYYDNLVIEP